MTAKQTERTVHDGKSWKDPRIKQINEEMMKKELQPSKMPGAAW